MDPVVLSPFPWKIAHPYELYSWFNINITYDTDVATFKAKKDTVIDVRKESEVYFRGNRSSLNTFSEVEDILQLCSSKLLCSSTLVAKEKDFSKIRVIFETEKNEFEYHYNNEMFNICCALVVGLKNKCDVTIIIATPKKRFNDTGSNTVHKAHPGHKRTTSAH